MEVRRKEGTGEIREQEIKRETDERRRERKKRQRTDKVKR